MAESIEGQKIEFMGDVRRLALGPDDILVIQSRSTITMEIADRMKSAIRDVLDDPERKILILSDGLEIGVIAKSGES